jgi:peptidoglycan hydrolase CwlO-like protein
MKKGTLIKYGILVAAVIAVIIWISLREVFIKKQLKRIANLEYSNFALERERNDLNLQLKHLQNEYVVLHNKNDSMKIVLKEKQKELRIMEENHRKVIDSLKNIPPDTAYKRLQSIYVNKGNLPLLYPFSSSQIIPIYSTVISFSLLSQEHSLQGKTLNSCLDLNKGYESGIYNLNLQIINLQDNISKADSQIGNYQGELKILNRRVKRKSFWNYSLMAVSGIAIGYSIIK